MIAVEPGDFVVIEQRSLDQVAVDRRQGQGLEAEHLPLGPVLGRLYDHQVLDADAVGAGLVVARLVRDDHPGQERLAVGRFRDALRPFVHPEIAADPVSRPVVVVEPLLP